MYLQPKAEIRNNKTVNECDFKKDGVAWSNNNNIVTRYIIFSVGAAIVACSVVFV
jgi:hypothetical protein